MKRSKFLISESLERELIAFRREIHARPELAFQEHATADAVATRLRALGLAPRTGVGETGIVVDVDGRAAGPTVLLRADMDALPVHERSDDAFASRVPGIMHACGHDAHTAALVGAATLLCGARDELIGRVRLVFQPAEESASGARAMLEADTNLLDGVSQVFAAHVLAQAPYGVVAVRSGPFLAGADAFELEVRGTPGHGGMPHLSADTVLASAHIVTALQAIVARRTKPGTTLVVSLTSIESGPAPNVVYDTVRLRGSVRWFDDEVRAQALAQVESISAGIGEALGASASFRVLFSAPVTSNDDEAVSVVRAAANEVGGIRCVDPGRITASEDFSEFLLHRPGAFFCVGAGGPDAAPHHHHGFRIDERCVAQMAHVLACTARRALTPPTERDA